MQNVLGPFERFPSQFWERVKRALRSGMLGLQTQLMKQLQQVRWHAPFPPASPVSGDVYVARSNDLPSQRREEAQKAILRGDVILSDVGEDVKVELTRQGDASLYTDVSGESRERRSFVSLFSALILLCFHISVFSIHI